MKINKITRGHNLQPYSYDPTQDFKVQMAPTKYCRICGREVLPYTMNEDNSVNEHLEFELLYNMHWKCYAKEETRVKAEAQKAIEERFEEIKKLAEEERKVSDEKAEEAIERMIKEIEERGHNT